MDDKLALTEYPGGDYPMQAPMGMPPDAAQPPPYSHHPQQQGYPPQHQGYPPQQQGYPSQMGQQVITTQPAVPMHSTVVVTDSSAAADRTMMLSVLNIVCCNPLFGIIALFFAFSAKDHFMQGREQEGANKLRTANILNIVGVFVTVIAIIILVAVWINV